MKLEFIKTKEEKYIITNLKRGLIEIGRYQKDLAEAAGIGLGIMRSIVAKTARITKEKVDHIKQAFNTLNDRHSFFELKELIVVLARYKVTNLNEYLKEVRVRNVDLSRELGVSSGYVCELAKQKFSLDQEKLDYLIELLEEMKNERHIQKTV